jgi:hypothetical protein
MEKINEVIEFVARRVMYSRCVFGKPTMAVHHFNSVDECIENHQKGGHGYTLPDEFLPYFLVEHHYRGAGFEVVKTKTLETTIVPRSRLKAACKVIWDRERAKQLTLFENGI